MSNYIKLGDNVSVHLPRLVETRMLLQCNSGGGKSWALRRILEQSHGKIQQIVLDLEGEFATLREKFDYLLVGKGGDVPISLKSAGLLAEKLLELNVSAIIDLYELSGQDRKHYVRLFLESMINARKELWHNCLVIVDEAHFFCLSEDTELLTSSGWKKYTEIKVGDLVAAFDLDSESYKFEPVLRLIVRKHKGEMIRLKSDGIDSLTTSDHRIVLRREQRASGRKQKLYPWTFCRASEIPQQIRIPIGSAPVGNGIPGLSADMAKLLGWIITDGNYTGGKSKRYLGISQAINSVKNGKRMIDSLSQLLGRLIGKVRYYERAERLTITDNTVVKHGTAWDFYLGKELSSQILKWFNEDMLLKAQRRIPRIILEQGNYQQLSNLYEGLLEGDGTGKLTWRAFYPGHNEGLADDFQELATKLSINAVKKFIPQNSQWMILISKRQHHYIRKSQKEIYDGLVWDITVPSGTFVVRRKGKVFVTGNCPEKGESEAAEAVNALVTRGRKRGFCAILATQRISKLHKDSAAECNNKLIGRCGLDIDMKRASDELGFVGRENINSLRTLSPGEFYTFGPAIADQVQKIKVGDVQTVHPKLGSRSFVEVVPPTDKIKLALKKLADLPQETEKKLAGEKELRLEIARLRGELTRANRESPKVNVDEIQIEKRLRREIEKEATPLIRQIKKYENTLIQIGKLINIEKSDLVKIGPLTNIIQNPKEKIRHIRPGPPRLVPEPKRFPMLSIPDENHTLTGPEQRILNAIGWMNSIGIEEPEQTAIAFLAGYTYGGGAFNNPKGALRSKHYVEYRGSRIILTQEGNAVAQIPNEPLTQEELHDRVLKVLGGPEQRILKPLLEAYPDSLTNEELAEKAGYIHTGGAFNNPRGRLKSLGLVEYISGGVKAADLLFIT